jgi:hypothetical protein
MTSEKKSFLLSQLQEAIDEAVSESGRVSDIVEEMKRSGYDLCLLLESTVTISPMEDTPADDVPQPRMESETEQTGEITLTDEDLEFLHEMNIAG